MNKTVKIQSQLKRSSYKTPIKVNKLTYYSAYKHRKQIAPAGIEPATRD